MINPDFRENQRLGAGQLNRIVEELIRLAKVSATLPLTVADDAAGFRFAMDETPPIAIKVTGGGPNAKYAWTKQIAAAGGGWTNDTVTGTVADDPAIESNGNAAVPVGTVILKAYRDRLTGELRFERGTC